MEEMHRNHKDATWGWVAVLLKLLDGFPRRRSRAAQARRLPARHIARGTA